MAAKSGDQDCVGTRTAQRRRNVAGLFLIGYALLHALAFSATLGGEGPRAFPLSVSSSSILDPLFDPFQVDALGRSLWLAAVMGFAIAGRGLLGGSPFSERSSDLAGAAAIVSMLLIVFFGHSWAIAGLVGDLLILALVRSGHLQPYVPSVAALDKEGDGGGTDQEHR